MVISKVSKSTSKLRD